MTMAIFIGRFPSYFISFTELVIPELLQGIEQGIPNRKILMMQNSPVLTMLARVLRYKQKRSTLIDSSTNEIYSKDTG